MKWVLTAVSKDRPGIVEDIAQIITEHEGNWVKSSMSRLGGQFAGIIQITVAQDRAQDLANQLQTLTAKDIQITMQKDELEGDAVTQGQMASLELTGIDHPGIVRDITHLLAAQQVTIETLETKIFTASMAGAPMFSAAAQIRLPQGLSLGSLSQAIETLADDIMVDINLEIDPQDQ